MRTCLMHVIIEQTSHVAMLLIGFTFSDTHCCRCTLLRQIRHAAFADYRERPPRCRFTDAARRCDATLLPCYHDAAALLRMPFRDY